MSDLELDNDTTLSKTHFKLLSDIEKLDKKQRIKRAEIKEPTLITSEFNLVKSGLTDKNTVNINNIIKNANRAANNISSIKTISRKNLKTKTLRKPHERIVQERIKRTVRYDEAKKELTKWDGIVARNRTVRHITFPLSQPCKKNDPQFEITGRCQLQSNLEKVFKQFEEPKESPTENEETEKFFLTKEELIEKRKEAAKLRALESYRAIKAHRQKKIKSKKFHRIQKKQKLKANIKEFEELQKNDPEAALEKLDLIDKVRAKERITLRHKNTGQWAKNLQIRAKYDKESRQALAQQLAISRELTQKLQKTEDTDDDDDENNELRPACITADDKENPWMTAVKPSEEINNFVIDYKKYWADKNKLEQNNTEEETESIVEKEKETPVKPIKITSKNNPVESIVDIDKDQRAAELPKKKKLKKKNRKVSKHGSDDYLEKLKLRQEKLKPSFDEPLMETTSGKSAAVPSVVLNEPISVEKDITTNKEINANSFIEVKPQYIKSKIPKSDINDDAIDDSDSEDQHQIISEAFEDDDAVKDFTKEKTQEIKSGIAKNIDLTLPGWGSWGGKGLKVPRRKRAKFQIKMPKPDKRKDENKGNVIIIEEKDPKIRKHMVNEVPFPFKTVKDFEASLRAPVGREFVSEKMHRKLILPAVTTKMGHIIEPIDGDSIHKKLNKKRKLFN